MLSINDPPQPLSPSAPKAPKAPSVASAPQGDATSISNCIFTDDYFDVSDSFLEAIQYPKYEI